MMNIRRLCVAFLLHYLIYQAYADTVICNPAGQYDTKTLLSVVEWRVTTDYQCLDNLAADCTYHLAFCQAASACFGQYSACQNATGANMTILGEHTTTQFYTDDANINGFYAKFRPGPMQNISNTTICQPKLRVNFICNPNVKWTIPNDDSIGYAPEPTDINIDPTDPCSTIMFFDYSGACKNGDGPTHDKISVGAIFLIVIFVSGLVYFILGAAYNGCVKHQSGINLIPHVTFWIGLPLYAIEGCRATLCCFSGRSQQSSAAYNSV